LLALILSLFADSYCVQLAGACKRSPAPAPASLNKPPARAAGLRITTLINVAIGSIIGPCAC
jgi:hypothetical protein